MMKLKDFDMSRLLVLELKLERCEVKQERCEVKQENSKEVKTVAEQVVAPVQDTAPATSNSDVCWGCLEEGDLSDMHKAFNEHDDTYADLIAYCFSIKVAEDVKSSKRKYFMCRSCITKLQDAVKFRRQLEIAQSFFNNLFPDQPEETKHDPDIHGSLLVPTSYVEFGEDDRMIVDEVTPESPPHSTPRSTPLPLQFTQQPLQVNPRNTTGRLYKMLPTDVNHLQPFCKAMDEIDISEGCRCPFCKEVFPTIAARRHHIRQTYGGRIVKFTCEECGKPFSVNSRMSAHVRKIHLQERKFTCNVCQKGFFRRTDVALHMNVHVKKKFRCYACNSAYATQDEMSHHRLVCTVADNNSDEDGGFNYDFLYQARNQSSNGPDVQDYKGPDGGTDSNTNCSEPDVSSVAHVSPVVTAGPSSSSGGLYFIVNHNQFQI